MIVTLRVTEERVSSTSHQSSGLAQLLLLRGILVGTMIAHGLLRSAPARSAPTGSSAWTRPQIDLITQDEGAAHGYTTPWPTRRFTTTQPPNITFSS